MSDRPSDQSTLPWTSLPSGPPLSQQKQKLQFCPEYIQWDNLVFLVLVPYGEFNLSSDDFYLDKFLVQGCAIAEAFSRRLPTAVGSRPGLASGICGGQSGVRAGFL
jgi:hypothetical protein